MNILRYLILLGILAIFLAGCAAPIELPLEMPHVEPEKECMNVTEEIPTTQEECTNISYTEEVCERRKLEYTATDVPIIHLCISDGACVGSPLSECSFCPKAMTRCQMIIKNEDKKTGSWKVGANYTLGNYGFVKDPITLAIEPGESAVFDFHQIYVPGRPISSASCKLFIISEPAIDDCHQETRMKRECANVTTYTTVQKEVCE